MGADGQAPGVETAERDERARTVTALLTALDAAGFMLVRRDELDRLRAGADPALTEAADRLADAASAVRYCDSGTGPGACPVCVDLRAALAEYSAARGERTGDDTAETEA